MRKWIRSTAAPFILVATACASTNGSDSNSKAKASAPEGASSTAVVLPVAHSNDKNARLVFFGAKDAYQAIGVSPLMPPLDHSGAENSSGTQAAQKDNGSKLLGAHGHAAKADSNPKPVDGDPDDASDKLAKADSDNKVWAACGGRVPSSVAEQKGNETIFLVLAGQAAIWIANKITTWVIDKASDAVQAEVNKYTVTHVTTDANVDFYNILTDGKGLPLGDKNGHVACYRYSLRGPLDPKDAKSKPTLMLDFIGSIKYDPTDPRVITLKPVRLYVRRVLAKNAGRDMAIQIKLTANTLAIKPDRVSYTEQSVNATVAAARFDATNIEKQPFYVTYDDSAPTTRIPLPEWDSTSRGRIAEHNGMDASLSVTEIGQVGALLKALDATLGPKNKDAVEKTLTDQLDTWLKSQINPSSKPGT